MGQKEEGKGALQAHSCGGGRRRRGASAAVASSERPAMTLDRRARAAPLPREQGRAAGVANAGDGVSVTDGRDQGKTGPGRSGWGAR
jgi:hypothetical protein